jgi:hypothetical protein
MILWYSRRKPYTYLRSRLALSPNSPKQDSTWPMSPSNSIVCVQNYFWACGTFSTNSAPILHQHKQCLQTDWNEIPHEPHDLGASSVHVKRFPSLLYVRHKPCTYGASSLSTISKWNETSIHLSLITKEYHRVHPKWFMSLWYFSANRAPILH